MAIRVRQRARLARWGALAVPLLVFGAATAVLADDVQWVLLGNQVLAVLVTYVVAVVGCLVCLAVTAAVTGGLRVNEDDEFAGLDLSQHSENAYVFGSGGGFEMPGYGAFGGRPMEHGAALAKVAE